MKENPLQYRVRGTPVPTTQTRGTNYPKSTMKRHRLSQIVFSWMVPCGKIAKKIKMKDRLIRGGLHRRLRGIF